MPVVHVEVGIVAVGMQFAAFAASDDDIHTRDIASDDIEVEWRNAHGDGHSDVVGIDGRQLVRPLHVSSGPLAARQQQYDSRYDGIIFQ